jgi:hypothetical protein
VELCNKIEDGVMARNLETDGDLQELREILIERLENEYNLKELQLYISLCGPHVDVYVESHKIITCILHLEQHVGLKIITLICAEGLDRYWKVHEQNEYITTVENVMNTRVFGKDDSPSICYFLRSLPEGEGQLYAMGGIRLPKTKVRKVMSFMNIIIGVCIAEQDRRNALLDAISHYRFAIHVVTCPRQYTKFELVCFKEDSHHVINLCNLLYRKECCTNYTHVFIDIRNKVGRHGTMTSFFFRRIKRGVHAYELESKSTLKPIARWVQRRYMHVSGITDAIFKENTIKNKRSCKRKVSSEWLLQERNKMNRQKDG